MRFRAMGENKLADEYAQKAGVFCAMSLDQFVLISGELPLEKTGRVWTAFEAGADTV